MSPAINSRSALALIGWLAASAAQAAPATWEGSLRLNSVPSPACDPFTPGQFFVSLFRPKFSASDPDAGLSIIAERSAQLYFLKGTTMPVPPSGTYGAQGIGSHAELFASGGFSGSFAVSHAPASLTATTPFITLSGKLTNFADLPGCTVTFSATYELRTD